MGLDLFKKNVSIVQNKDTKKEDKNKDYLDEDAVIPGQSFFLLSYFLTEYPEAPAMFKFRGAFGTIEEAESKIKELRSLDQFTHIFTCESGKWTSLYSSDKLAEVIKEEKEFKIDYSYSNVETNNFTKEQVRMNDIMKNFKKKIDESQEHLEKRVKQGDSGDLVILNEDISNLKARIKTDMLHLKELQAKLQTESTDINKLIKG